MTKGVIVTLAIVYTYMTPKNQPKKKSLQDRRFFAMDLDSSCRRPHHSLKWDVLLQNPTRLNTAIPLNRAYGFISWKGGVTDRSVYSLESP